MVRAKAVGLTPPSLVVHRLRAVVPCAKPHVARYARDAHLVQHFVTALHGSEYIVPFAFDISAISVQADPEVRP